MPTKDYIVAVRRDRRDDAPSEWLKLLGEVEGVSVVRSSPRRVHILANDVGIERVHLSLGAYLHVEPVMAHQVQ